jgi:acyl-[acyl-carrier-protein] desaturase
MGQQRFTPDTRNVMDTPIKPESPEILAEVWRLYRDFFDQAERKRRWNVRDDIAWDQCNPNLDPAIADVVQTFCAVELYLPDYLSKHLPQVRDNPGRAFMLANWGYEESKHSLVLSDWLVRSGHRTEKQMADITGTLYAVEWNLPQDNARAMSCYSMLQELATWLHYRNLRLLVGEQDPALAQILMLIAVDEKAHADFFKKLMRIYLEYDRPGTLEQLQRVINSFDMPATNMLLDGRRRVEAVKALRIFDADIYCYQIVEPLLADLQVQRSELRRRNSRKEVMLVGGKS